MKRLVIFLAVTLTFLAGCAPAAVSPESALSLPASSASSRPNAAPVGSSFAESEESASLPPPTSASSAPQQAAAANPFVLDPGGEYDLYAYNAALVGYANLGYAYWSVHAGASQPELEAAVAAINALPPLAEKTGAAPAAQAAYGLMTVEKQNNFAKRQYFLYEDALAVDGTVYSITPDQYTALQKAMAVKSGSGYLVTPYWLAYMNPNRVTKVMCTGPDGQMQEIKTDNMPVAACEPQYLGVTSVKTYTPGTKDVSQIPFKAVYTFDSGVTYTLYVTNATPRVPNVTFYLESSDMNVAYEYTSVGYISNFVEATQGMINGPANPRTM